jgi:hypothetical protein
MTQWYSTTTDATGSDATGSDGYVYYDINTDEYKMNYDTIKWDEPQVVENSSNITFQNYDPNVNFDVYIDGLPVNERLAKLEKVVKILWEMLEPTYKRLPRGGELAELIEELNCHTEEPKMTYEQEEKILKDELFEI